MRKPASTTQAFNVQLVEAALAGGPFAGRLHHCEATPSTNTLALAAGQAGEPAGVWVADEQTAGRGRGGHRWHSVADEGLYASVLVRPSLRGADTFKLSLAAGLAVRHAVLATTPVRESQIDLRWPNDLLLTGADGVARKFGGILTESAMHGGDGRLAYAVLGLGVNLNHCALPAELAGVATSVLRETGARTPRESLLQALLPALAAELGAVEREAAGTAEAHVPGLSARFEQASSWVRGLHVQVAEDSGYTGWTAGLDAHGLLLVRLADGSTRTVRHGGVRHA